MNLVLRYSNEVTITHIKRPRQREIYRAKVYAIKFRTEEPFYIIRKNSLEPIIQEPISSVQLNKMIRLNNLSYSKGDVIVADETRFSKEHKLMERNNIVRFMESTLNMELTGLYEYQREMITNVLGISEALLNDSRTETTPDVDEDIVPFTDDVMSNIFRGLAGNNFPSTRATPEEDPD